MAEEFRFSEDAGIRVGDLVMRGRGTTVWGATEISDRYISLTDGTIR